MQIKKKKFTALYQLSDTLVGFLFLFLISILSRKTHDVAYSYHLVLIKMGCCCIFLNDHQITVIKDYYSSFPSEIKMTCVKMGN